MRKYQIEQFVSHSKSRRRGQALLLSVIIMIFIVLLGTTFIAIVASNMSNTARTGAKDEARQAAKAGIEFADSQLTGSDAGLDWRPTLPATPGNFYYTSFDQAQGWSQAFYDEFTPTVSNPVPSLANFVKYPNFQGTSPSDTSANFMIRVSQVQANELPDNADNTKTGDIRIESIGFANDDPAAYYSTVAYKQGPANDPLTGAMRSVTNWDFTSGVVPQGEMPVTSVAGQAVLGTTLTLPTSEGYFDPSETPFYVTITALDGATNVVGALVTGVTYSGTTPTLTLNGSVTVNMSTGSGTLVVQKAAGLGAPSTLSFDNAVAMNDPAATPVDYRISSDNNFAGTSVDTPGSVWVNGGLVWFGTNYADNLVAPSAATAAKPASFIKVSGLFAPDAVSGATVKATGTNVAAPTALPTSSLDTNYGSNPLVMNGLLDDGVNRMRGSLSPTRQVQNFTPPDITSGGDGFGRYRQLTQYSASMDSNNPQASAYGYGQGIYINNPQDVEKVGTTAMTQTQLQELWYGTGTTNSYDRLGTPDSPAITPSGTTGSLEGQHMRGWVSPDQFLPRGAEVIINPPGVVSGVSYPNGSVTVNLDPMEDNSAAYPSANLANSPFTPDPAKGWRNMDGTLAGDSTNGGVYSQTFNWPADGTLFAEGNIRIRGVNTAAPNSLTVVSMNNIYIEGSLSTGAKKVLLLAKKNVIVNPTQVLEDVQAVTRLSAATVVGGTTVNVYDAANLKAGDFIQISGDPNTYQIQSISGTTTITLDSALLTSQLANSVVTAAFDPRTDVGSYAATDSNKPYNTAIRLSQPSNVIQRRLQWPSTSTNIRLAFRHSAEYRKALEVAIQHPTATPPPPLGPDIIKATLTNKIQLPETTPQDIIQAADKTLTVTYSDDTPTTGTDTFLATPPADQATAASTTLNTLVTDMIGKHPNTQWNYGDAPTPTPITTVDPNYASAAKQPPYYFLASAGSRYPLVTSTAGAYPPTTEPSEPVYPTPSSGEMNLPMATSVRLLMNNAQSPLELFPGLDIVNQFGFSPLFADPEDVLTTDQYFYQPHVPTAPDATYPGYYPGVPDSLTGNYTTTYAGQNKYDSTDGTNVTQYTLDSRTLGQAPNDGTNEIALQLNNATVDSTATPATTVQSYFGTKTPLTASPDPSMPFYRLSNLKLQNEAFDSSAPPNLDQVSPPNLDPSGSGTLPGTLNINAYVYAQEGGWYVISGADFDPNVKNGQDLNRDGVISQGESAAAYRYHRYNYQIVFTGAIMENQTASPTDVSDWMDKWATVNLKSTNFSAGSVVPTTSLTYDSSNPATSNLGTIAYYYDPAAAQGALVTDPGFHAPVAPGLIYQG